MAERAIAAERRSGRAGRRWPLRAYLGLLIALFVVTAIGSIVFVRGPQDRNATRAAQQDDCGISADAIGPFGTPRIDLVRTDGTVLCSSAPRVGPSAAWRVDVTKATPIAIAADPVSGRPSAVSIAPVVGRGAVVASVDLTPIGPTLAPRYAGAQNAELLIVSADGTIVARSLDPAKSVGTNVGVTPFVAGADPAVRPDVDGVARIYGSAAVAGAGWTVYAGVDQNAALMLSRDVARQQVTVTLIGLLVLLGGSVLVYRAITAPLGRLSEAMGRGTSGLIRGPIEPAGPAEIAGLTTRFNALVAAVRTEITERGRAEELAHESERNYRLLFDGNPQPIFVYDLDTLAFLEVNEGAIRRYGYTRDEFRSMTVHEILTPEGLALLPAVKTNPDVHASPGPRTHRLKDGSLIDVETTSIRLVYDGHDSRMVVVQDLTEQKKLEGQLQQSQRLETVGQLAGGIAHDFNNLLAVILNYADFVAEELPEGQLKDDVAEIQRAATRAADLTRQLLIFARREVANPQVLDLNTVVTGVEKLLRRTLGEDVTVDLSLGEALTSSSRRRSRIWTTSMRPRTLRSRRDAT